MWKINNNNNKILNTKNKLITDRPKWGDIFMFNVNIYVLDDTVVKNRWLLMNNAAR